MSTVVEDLDYFDLDIFGRTNRNGELRTLSNVEAVKNALMLWIVSIRGEILRRPRKGGYVTQWLLKPVSPDRAQSIRDAILQGLQDDFPLTVRVRSLDVEPLYGRSAYRVELIAYIPVLKERIEVDVNVNSLMNSFPEENGDD